MASVLLSPVGNGQQFFDNNGVPLSGGLIYTYQAGSSTLLTTYTTVNGTVANSNPIVLDSSGRPANEIWMQTNYSYKFIIQTSGGTTLQTLDNLYPILQNATATAPALPSGAILLWSGSIGAIPSGYVLCDGTNSTPDLRDRFVVAAGNLYSVGQTGGSADAIVVSHTHTATSTSTVTDPGHNHLTPNSSGSIGGSSLLSGRGFNTDVVSTSVTGITVATATTNATAGVSGTGANNPLFYALAYIMKS
jgi:hypothetical protein